MDMASHSKKFFAGMACLLFVFSASMGFLGTQIYEGNYNFSEPESVMSADSQPKKPRQFRWLEEYSVCAQHGLSCQPIVLQGDEATETMLRDLPLSQLAERYMLPEWRISEMEETVTICRNREGMCPEHKQMYHLGLNENGQYMAVYYGPSAVGSDGGTFLVTEVPVDRLSPQQRSELEDGSYEYSSQDELIAMLDNFSEL